MSSKNLVIDKKKEKEEKDNKERDKRVINKIKYNEGEIIIEEKIVETIAEEIQDIIIEAIDETLEESIGGYSQKEEEDQQINLHLGIVDSINLGIENLSNNTSLTYINMSDITLTAVEKKQLDDELNNYKSENDELKRLRDIEHKVAEETTRRRLEEKAMEASMSRIVKLPDNITFTGTGKDSETVVTWLFAIQQQLEILKIHTDDWGKLAACNLREKALIVYREAKLTHGDLTWKELGLLLQKNFQPINQNKMLIEMLSKLKQTGSFEDYIDKYYKLKNEITKGSLSDEAFVVFFTAGLQQRVREYCKLQDLKSLEDVVAQGRKFEASLYVDKKLNENNISYPVEQDGYLGQEIANYIEAKTQKIECSFCHKKGHSERECFKKHPELKNKSKSNRSDNNRSDNYRNRINSNPGNKIHKDRPDIKCFNCGKMGHFSNNCSSPKNNNNEGGQNNRNKQKNLNVIEAKEINMVECISLPDEELDFAYSTALINNVRMEVLHDSGAKYSVIPFTVILKYNMPYIASKSCCTLANGTKTQINGTAKLRVILAGSISEINFLIQPRKNVLLGVDWEIANQAYISLPEKKLVYLQRSVQLNEKENSIDSELTLSSINIVDMEEKEMDETEFYDVWDSDPKLTDISKEIQANELISLENKNKLIKMITKNKDVFASSFKELEVN